MENMKCRYCGNLKTFTYEIKLAGKTYKGIDCEKPHCLIKKTLLWQVNYENEIQKRNLDIDIRNKLVKDLEFENASLSDEIQERDTRIKKLEIEMNNLKNELLTDHILKTNDFPLMDDIVWDEGESKTFMIGHDFCFDNIDFDQIDFNFVDFEK